MERALAAERADRWTEAALAWEALTLVHPEDPRAQSRLLAARRHVSDRADAQHKLAEAALRRGDVAAAVQGYLEVLALDPSRTAAADALRQIERDRTRRAQVGRFARAPAVGMADNSERGRSASNLREHASLLSTQGDIDSAIQLLRESPLLRQDTGVRALLVDLYVRKAESTRAAQPAVARAAVDAALTLDPRHAAALALRKQLPPSRARANPPTTPAAPRAGSSR